MKIIRKYQRRGFSLIELLVVIAIITLLAGLVALALPNIISGANEANTKATIKKVNELLLKRMHAIEREIKDQDQRAVGGIPAYLTDSPYVSMTPRDKALVLARKYFIRRHLPMNFAEAERTPAVGGGHTSQTENAEILYYFLTNGPQFDAAPVDTDYFRATELEDSDGDGAFEIIDAWGNPLRFYRWPTRLIRPAPAGDEADPQNVEDLGGGPEPDAYLFKVRPNLHDIVAGITARVLISAIDPKTGALPTTFLEENTHPLAKDPDDPLGMLRAASAADAADMEANFHTPDTWHTPLVVSSGRDGVLGLYEPYDTANHGHLAQPNLSDVSAVEGLLDNLTNRQE